MLNIITACIRPKNLHLLHDSIWRSVENYGSPVNLKWHIVLDGMYRNLALDELINVPSLKFETKFPTNIQINNSHLKKRNSPINVALNDINEGLVTILDDDNVLHPNFIKTIYPRYLSGVKGFLYHQQLSKDKNLNNRVRFAKHANLTPGKIDTAQFCFDKSLIGKITWDSKSPQPDGAFINQVCQASLAQIVILDEILCYYNYLSIVPNKYV